MGEYKRKDQRKKKKSKKEDDDDDDEGYNSKDDYDYHQKEKYYKKNHERKHHKGKHEKRNSTSSVWDQKRSLEREKQRREKHRSDWILRGPNKEKILDLKRQEETGTLT